MNYKNFSVPFLSNTIIKNKADLFRKRFWNGKVPIDIEKIIDVKLKIDIIPVKNSSDFFGADALITSNWQAVYVDYDKYLSDNQNRLRFSFAHEMGHFILHKNIYKDFQIKSFENFYSFLREIPGEQYSYLETQANKFANFLLVPRNKLVIQKSKILQKIKKSINLNEQDINTLNSYLAIPLSKVFGVSEQVVEIALKDA